ANAPVSQTYLRRTAAILLPRLTINGVQRVHAHIAEELVAQGFCVDLITFDPNGPMNVQFKNNIDIVSTGRPSGARYFLWMFIYLIKNRPNVVISAYDDVSVAALIIKNVFKLKYG